MNREYESFLSESIKKYEQEYYKLVAEDCKKLLHEALMETVFEYNPIEYRRTGQLEDINNIKIDIKGDNAYIYFDTDNMKYYSFWKGEGYSTSGLNPIGGDALVQFLEVGHDSYSPYEGDADHFHHYTAQHFLELAQQKIKAKYPSIQVNVIRDQPKIY